MSAAKKNETKSYELTGSWANAWKTFAGIGVVGLAGAGFGATQDTKRFAFSWLFAFITCLAVALGATFFVLIQRLTAAHWSVTVRRTAEFFSNGLLVLIPLAIPIFLMMNQLFPWVAPHGGHEGGEHGQQHGEISLIRPAHAEEHAPEAAPVHGEPAGPTGDPAGRLPGAHREPPRDTPHAEAGEPDPHGAFPHAGPGMPDPHAVIHAEIMEKKAGFLNKNFFIARGLIYFLIWGLLATRLFGFSTAQDKSKDPNLTLAAQRFAPPATFLFALSLTFAAFDWVMSLEPSWFSTIFGVYYFATGVVSSLAVIILVTMALRNAGPLSGVVTVEHYHDLGKLLFGFLVFWAYIGFSQFMLIWYAALPEETTWYHNRWDIAPWSTVSMAIVALGFVAPFFWLISRNFKRNLGRLQVGAVILLVMHVIDMYWFVMPNYMLGKDGFGFHWMDAACLLAVVGIYGAFVFFRMTKYPLIPVGDPRLPRSLHFQNA